MKSLSFILASLAGFVHAATNDVTLDIFNVVAAPDGFVRSLVTANGTFPGPLIKATKGDTVRVTANNKLTDPTMRRSTSINFDGIFFDTENSYNEGTPFVTSCPLGPNTSYTYELPLVQTGSYWYHSDVSVQYGDGLRGPFIIYDPDDPQAHLYDVDDESTIWQVGDWWHNTSVANLASYIPSELIPVSDSGTFNGAGRYNGGPLVPYAVSNVKSGVRYRFRIINISTRSSFTMSIDNHTMTIIAADGVPLVSHEVNEFIMHAGQRYDVVVTANQPVGNYWINAILSGGNPAHNLNLNATLGRGVFRYEGAPNEEPTTPMTLGPVNPNFLNEGDLRPLFPEPAPIPTINFTLSPAMNVGGPAVWNLNVSDTQYISPTVPTLVKVLDGVVNASGFNSTENTFIIPKGAVVQVTFPPDPDDELHPFHLHGNNYYVIKANQSDEINLTNPLRRDVTALGNGGTILRFTTDRPGPWFFHCHIFYHLAAGLGSVMLEDPITVEHETKPTKVWDDLCAAYNALPPELQ
uniref:Laccase 2 n=1 Tax=Mycena chlorophos TaxID=658473 RepID=A0ABQ0M4Q8_MYCCL|nr:laccase 2 precursor [Mycena chlorophos]